MARAAALSILIFVPVSSASAQQSWRLSSSGAGQRAFIDTSSIRRNGDKVRFIREIHIGEVRQLGNGDNFDRIGGITEADCRARTLRSYSIYAKMGDTMVLNAEDDSGDEAVRAGSTAEGDLLAVCFNQWPRQPADSSS